MTHVIKITPAGEVIEYGGNDLLSIARDQLGDVTVLTLLRPHGAPPEFPQWDGYLVGCVAEWANAARNATVNPKAWALYGRSPLAGDVFIANDQTGEGPDRPDLDPALIARLRDDWVQEPLMLVSEMQRIAGEAGLAWPS